MTKRVHGLFRRRIEILIYLDMSLGLLEIGFLGGCYLK